MAVGRCFFLCSPDCPKQPRIPFPFQNFFYPSISCRISVWCGAVEQRYSVSPIGQYVNTSPTLYLVSSTLREAQLESNTEYQHQVSLFRISLTSRPILYLCQTYNIQIPTQIGKQTPHFLCCSSIIVILILLVKVA